MRTFIVCETPEHADVVDQFIMERLRDVDGAHGSSWSGVFVRPNADGSETYGVLWGSPVSELFGNPPTPENPDGDPSVVLVDEIIDAEGNSDWQPLPAPNVEENPL